MMDNPAPNDAGRIYIRRGCIIATVLSLIAASGLCILLWHQCDHNESFDSAKWKGDEPGARMRMVDDLLDRHNGLKGMTRANIDILLGIPDFQYGPDGPDNNYGPRYKYKYYLDLDRGLTLHFDTVEVVIGVRKFE